MLCGNSAANAEETISFGFSDWKPAAYMNEQGEPAGILIDIVTKIFEENDALEPVFRYRPWKRTQIDVQKGNTDFMITLPTEDRLTYSNQSKQPIFKIFLDLHTYVGHPKLSEILKIKTAQDIIDLNLTSLSNLGNGWHKNHIEASGVRTLIAPTDENTMQILAHKRADILIEPSFSTSETIKTLGLEDMILNTGISFDSINFHLLMSKKSKHVELLPEIEKTMLRLVDDGIISAIFQKHNAPYKK